MPIGEIVPPTVGIQESPTTCIEINVEWAAQLLGIIIPAKYPEYWAGTLEQNRFARQQIKELLYIISKFEECGDMSNNCCLDLYIIQHINVTTGMIEISIDNGATWQPKPGSIPTMIVTPIPPVTSGTSATKCDAATNVQTQVSDWIDHVGTAFDVAVTLLDFGILVIGAIANAILLILTEGGLTALEAEYLAALGAVMTAVWTGGKALFVDYWSSENKDIVLCAAYCTIAEDGSFSDAQFSAFWNKCSSDLPGGIAKSLFLGFISSVGSQGLSAMAATGLAADADCTACDCNPDCGVLYWPGNPDKITFIEGCTWRLESVEESGHQAVYAWIDNATVTFDPTKCGTVVSWAIHTGSDVDQNWNECTTGTFHGHSNPTGHSCSQLYFTSGAPFTIDIWIAN